MFLEAALARRELARHLTSLNYSVDPTAWSKLCMAIKRDLQAKRLRPNVPIPPRRNPIAFLKIMQQETGSITKALAALVHDGPWTSSGGSFRLAEQIGVDIHAEAEKIHQRKNTFRFLEIGAAWAGFGGGYKTTSSANIASLADRFWQERGNSVFLHFTNLTPWHAALPDGVYEHPYVTAAGLATLERQGVQPGSVDILFSQAAAYFETDHVTFMRHACRLIGDGGMMIFNHRPEIAGEMDHFARSSGLELTKRIHLGGMNGDVVRYDRVRAGNGRQPVLGELQPIQREAFA